MGVDPHVQPDVLLIAASDRLAAWVTQTLEAWDVRVRRLSEEDALLEVRSNRAHVVVSEASDSARLFGERVIAAGGVPIILGAHAGHAVSDVELAERRDDLVRAVFRGQGRVGHAEAAGDRISRFAQAIATQFTLPELMQAAVAKTRELVEADGASLLLIDHHTGELYFDVVDGSGAGRMERIRLDRGKGVAGRVAIEAEPRLVIDASQCPDFDPSIDKKTGFSTGSIVAVPLVLAGDVLGVLMAVRSVTSPRFTPANLERLVQLAPHVAIAVHNAQITAALRASQAETMQANAGLEQKVRERTEQISRAKQEWERTFDAIDEPIALVEGYVIRRTNQAYARKVGRPVKELPGKKCYQVLAGRDAPCAGCPLAQERRGSLSAELEMHDAGGRRTIQRFSGYWMSDEEADQSVVVHYQDVTQSKQLADRLRESERLAAVGQLASGAAHEINNPLGFVTSNLRSLRTVLDEVSESVKSLEQLMNMAKSGRAAEIVDTLRSIPPPDMLTLEDAVAMIDESLDGARRVGDIVKGLRELSRLEIGKRERADVNASITRAVRSEFGDAIGHVGLEVVAGVHADIAPLQLDQALTHVLRNARQAAAPGQRIAIKAFALEGEVVIQVRDEGVGIAKENLRRVFEPFFTTRGVGKGIGLGLTAAYGIVKRAGGDIEASSDGPGKGSTFTLRLPRVVSTDHTHAAA